MFLKENWYDAWPDIGKIMRSGLPVVENTKERGIKSVVIYVV